jgi:hypothetical protein
VLQARRVILEALEAAGDLRIGSDPSLGVQREADTRMVGLLDRQHIANKIEVKSLLESPVLANTVAKILGSRGSEEQPGAGVGVGGLVTTEYKWLRAVAKGEFTGAHTDRVYVGEGSQRLLTVWLPLGEVSPEQGAMRVLEASHRPLPGLEELREVYGRSKVGGDGTRSGWIGVEEAKAVEVSGAKWVTTTFQPGDVCVLGLDTIHMTGPNQTERLRISCDTRWQPAEDPTDPRLGRVRPVVA